MGKALTQRSHVAALSVAGLALGFALGIAAFITRAPFLVGLADIVGPLGKLWTQALQSIVIPLVVCLLFSSIGAMPSGKAFGKWGWTSAAVFLGLLLLGAAFAVAGSELYMASLAPEAVLASPNAAPEETAARLTFADWVIGLMPSNLFEALAKGDLLPVMILTIFLAMATRTLPDDPKERLIGLFSAGRDAILKFVHWLMVLLPFGAFALAFAFAATKGFEAAGVVFHFLVLGSALLIVYTLVLYPLAAILGNIPIGRFAKAVLEPQAVAVSTRSSVASLPALVEAADERLLLPAPAGSFVLPLAASVFKLNRTVSSTGKVLFAAYVLGMPLSTGTLVAFVLTVILLSVSTPGIPSTGSNVTLGAYVAAGIPAEVALLFEPVEPILDMLKTALNVTGNLAAAAIVSRFCASREPMPTPVALEATPAEA